jgi:hypothetical protein
MKKSILIIALFICFGFTTTKSDFCDGWEDGYCEGWRDVKGQLAICPITPVCPIPKIGTDTYKGGYNRGFKAGSKKAKE